MSELLPYEFRAATLDIATPLSAADASRIADMNINCAIIPFDTGLPPEKAAPRHEYFAAAAALLDTEGVSAIATISTSLYHPQGSYKSTGWHAVRPGSLLRLIPFDDNGHRMMTCWSSDQWAARVESACLSALDSGAAGIFLDFICFGATPAMLGSRLEGPAGCACPTCKRAYSQWAAATGANPRIPARADLLSKDFIHYSLWRQSIVTSRLDSLEKSIRTKSPSALIVLNAPFFGAIPSGAVFGLDPQYALTRPDVLCISHRHAPALSPIGLHYSTPLVKAAAACSTRPLVASLPSHFDPKNRLHDAETVELATAIAAGATAIVSHDNPHTSTIAAIHNWIDKNPQFIEDSRPANAAGIAFSYTLAECAPASFLPYYHTITRVLTETQLPLSVLAPEAITPDACDVLIIPCTGDPGSQITSAAQAFAASGKPVIAIGQPRASLPGNCAMIPPEAVLSSKNMIYDFTKFGRLVERAAYGGKPSLYSAATPRPPASGSPETIEEYPSVLATYQPGERWGEIRSAAASALQTTTAAMPEILGPPTIHETRVLCSGGKFAFHVINLLPDMKSSLPQMAALRFPVPVKAKILSPFSGKTIYRQASRIIEIDTAPWIIIELI